MERIVLRHLGGSKTSQVEEFPLKHFRELVIGRDPKAEVKYDPDRDDLVSRQHAKIVQDTADPTQFLITDLNSRNGTFVNKQRITGTVRLGPGDVVQLGAGGPEFQFDVEPRPDMGLKTTRLGEAVVSAPGAPLPSTRVGTAQPEVIAGAPVAHAGVGKATVERMITQTTTTTRKTMMVAIAAVVIVVALVAAFLMYQNYSAKQQLAEDLKIAQDQLGQMRASAPMSPADIAKAFTNSVVYIECGWKLIYTPTGGQVYHRYLPNEYRAEDGTKKPLIDDGRKVVAAYLAVGDLIEPALTLDSGGGVPIGGEHTGSGFTVTSDGFILTNRHVAAAWHTIYQFPRDATPGVILNDKGQIVTGKDGSIILVQAPWGWVPARAKQAGTKLQGGFEGRNDYLNVTFAKQQSRIPAQIARISDRHDVAMIRIQVPEPVLKVDLLDNYDKIQPGDSVVVLGYPVVSPSIYAVAKSQDAFNPEARVRIVPDPTVTVGNIGRLLRGQKPEGTSEKETALYSEFGDAYQLTINATGGGNSGGPLFEDHGRVVGIFFASRTEDARITFAVPIRYAMELMSATPGSR